MASLAQRIAALEASVAADAGGGGGEAGRLRRKFMQGALDAMALVKRTPIDRPPWRYDIEKLHDLGPFAVATYVAALTALEHEDEDEAREILAELVEARGIDPVPLEALIDLFIGVMTETKLRRESQGA